MRKDEITSRKGTRARFWLTRHWVQGTVPFVLSHLECLSTATLFLVSVHNGRRLEWDEMRRRVLSIGIIHVSPATRESSAP